MRYALRSVFDVRFVLLIQIKINSFHSICYAKKYKKGNQKMKTNDEERNEVAPTR